MSDDKKPWIRKDERFPEDHHDVKGRPLDEDGDPDANEGEGNKSADRNYREGVAKTVKSGTVDEKAKEAEAALDGPEGEKLRRAEELGKMRSKGEDPQLKKKK